jgi:hypothetical protein
MSIADCRDVPTSGRCLLDGADVSRLSTKQLGVGRRVTGRLVAGSWSRRRHLCSRAASRPRRAKG